MNEKFKRYAEVRPIAKNTEPLTQELLNTCQDNISLLTRPSFNFSKGTSATIEYIDHEDIDIDRAIIKVNISLDKILAREILFSLTYICDELSMSTVCDILDLCEFWNRYYDYAKENIKSFQISLRKDMDNNCIKFAVIAPYILIYI